MAPGTLGTGTYVGVDIGSATVKVVGINEEGDLVGRPVYLRHDAFPSQVEALKTAFRRYLESTDTEVLGVGTTGSGRELNRHLLNASLARTEIFAHTVGIDYLLRTGQVRDEQGQLVERAGSVIEIGGQDSKVIIFDSQGKPAFFNMNSICSAGTGEFLKQIADEAGIGVEQFGPQALDSRTAAQIDATCTVFSKRDFRHLTQKGVPLADRLMGVAHALVRNYLNNVTAGHRLRGPIIFQGGVAFNVAVRRAFEERLGLPVIVPPWNDVVGALGMALLVREQWTGRPEGLARFDPSFFEREFSSRIRYCHGCQNGCELTQPLEVTENGIQVLDTLGGRCEGSRNPANQQEAPRESARLSGAVRINPHRRPAPPVLLGPARQKRPAREPSYFAGIDGGSRGTKWAVFRDPGQGHGKEGADGVEIVGVGSVDTAGDAVRALRQALVHIREALEEARGREAIESLRAIGTTGSAGELAQHILCERETDTADYRSTEIIAHYTWARHMVPDVGTVLDIGGNDAKIVTVQETGLDFAMNDKCAAGTGSFLEAVARRFRVPIAEYGDLALTSRDPAQIAGRCAVFGESDVIHKARLGFGTADLLAGVAESIARNYLSDVAKGKEIRLPIVAQGGGFLNRAVFTAFQRILAVPEDAFLVAEDPRLVVGAGALGAALLAREMFQRGYPSTFKGFDRVLSGNYTSRTVTCPYPACSRRCEGLILLEEEGQPVAGYRAIDCPYGFFSGQITEEQQKILFENAGSV